MRSYTIVSGKRYNGAWSDTKSVTTAKYDIAKAKVAGIKNKSFTGRNITQSIQKLMPVKKGFYIDYAQKGSATGYEISYAENISFSGAKTVKVTSKKTDKKTVTDLKSQKTYFVRVRSYTATGNKTYFGQWSDIAKVYTK